MSWLLLVLLVGRGELVSVGGFSTHKLCQAAAPYVCSVAGEGKGCKAKCVLQADTTPAKAGK